MTSRVFPRPARNPAAAARLVCLPFAGGSAASYAAFEPALAEVAEVLPAELPGRGARAGEPCAQDLPTLANDIAAEIAALPQKPLVLYGHSMGAILAHAVARALAAGGACPAGLVLTGRRAPHRHASGPPRHLMSDADLAGELRRTGGTPEALFARPELLALFLPPVRGDYRLVETYRPDAADLAPFLDCPVDLVGGTRDAGNPEEAMAAWGEVLARPPSLAMWEGDHFFIRPHQARLVAHLRARLGDWTGPGAR